MRIMADFRMHGAMDRAAVEGETPADAGADGDVAQAVGWPIGLRACSPAQFRQRGAVDVDIDRGGAIERRGQRAENISACPTELGRRQHEAEIGCAAVQTKRTEAADPDRCEGRLGMPAFQDLPAQYRVAACAQHEDLGSPEFDPGQHRFSVHHRVPIILAQSSQVWKRPTLPSVPKVTVQSRLHAEYGSGC